MFCEGRHPPPLLSHRAPGVLPVHPGVEVENLEPSRRVAGHRRRGGRGCFGDRGRGGEGGQQPLAQLLGRAGLPDGAVEGEDAAPGAAAAGVEGGGTARGAQGGTRGGREGTGGTLTMVIILGQARRK